MAHRGRYEYRKRKKEKEMKIANRSPKENMIREIWGWVVYLFFVIACVYLVITYVGQRTLVSGTSMENALHDKDNLIVDKITYRLRDPERYEIIVFPYRYEENTHYIKRIIGLPGETVQIIDGYVYINGRQLDEHYGKEVMLNPGIAEEPIELGEDEYFVLGDNRNNSADSREASVGVLKRDEIIGRAWLRIWPLSDIGVVSHE